MLFAILLGQWRRDWCTINLMITSNLTLYELAGADPAVRFSPHCWTVVMALAHKGLEAARVPLRFSDIHKVAFSGQALLPVLTHGTEIIGDSWRIALHLLLDAFGGFARSAPTARS